MQKLSDVQKRQIEETICSLSFEEKLGQIVFVSATPGPYEERESSSVVEQLIRPTGLVDPEIFVRPIEGMFNEI